MMGIYLLTNLINNKKYIGCSIDIKRRFIEHRSHKNSKQGISLAILKYGKNNFKYEIIEEVCLIDNLAEREIFWIKTLKPEYNRCKGGKGSVGHCLSNELKECLKISGKLQWKLKTEQEKNKIIKNNLKGRSPGFHLSKESKEFLRKRQLNKKLSQEIRDRIGKSNEISMLGNKNGNKSIIKIKNNKELRIYESCAIAAKELNIHPSSITKVLKGHRKTAGGFNWKYL